MRIFLRATPLEFTANIHETVGTKTATSDSFATIAFDGARGRARARLVVDVCVPSTVLHVVLIKLNRYMFRIVRLVSRQF